MPIPLFGSKIEAVIAEQIGTLLASEEIYTRELGATVPARHGPATPCR